MARIMAGRFEENKPLGKETNPTILFLGLRIATGLLLPVLLIHCGVPQRQLAMGPGQRRTWSGTGILHDRGRR